MGDRWKNEELRHSVEILERNARGLLRELEVRVNNNGIDLAFLLDVQSTFILGLSDLSLYSFALKLDDIVEKSYRTFVEGYELLRKNGLLVNIPELDLQLGYLRGLNVERGFSLDRRLSLLGEPKEIQVWVNRIIKLRNALHGNFPKDPLRELGYGIESKDRKFPVLLRALRRMYTMNPPGIEDLSRLVHLEIREGIVPKPLQCRDGRCEIITNLESTDGFTVVENNDDVILLYRFEDRKSLKSPWGSIEIGKPVEIIVFSRKMKKGIRCSKGVV
ncbi:hypothetical protein A3K92_03940 [Thermococcus gorgonarius]|uniref:Uncharacterized protein n=2 Tax=Thermococcus gorgonarius TaxID=71997 RepID=A0A2Z2M5D4_THEGO|nr:hypothetical protein A3K92_03940 [Thermococcus gorgonarius]